MNVTLATIFIGILAQTLPVGGGSINWPQAIPWILATISAAIALGLGIINVRLTKRSHKMQMMNIQLSEENLKLNKSNAEQAKRSREVSVKVTTEIVTRAHERMLIVTVLNTGADIYDLSVGFRHPKNRKGDTWFALDVQGDCPNPMKTGQSRMFHTVNPDPTADSQFANDPIDQLSIVVFSGVVDIHVTPAREIVGFTEMLKADPSLPAPPPPPISETFNRPDYLRGRPKW
jgi:hypothetical protein